MSDPDFLGLRDGDLTDSEREQLAGDPILRARHEEELSLGGRLHELSDPPAQRRPSRKVASPRWPVVVSGLALAAGVLLTVGSRQAVLTPRGMGDATLSVRLDAVETTQRRALVSGDRLGADEAVAFRVQASAPGMVRITEDGGTPVYPPSGTWRVEAGEHWLGGEAAPLQWRTDAGAGVHQYRVELCVSAGECVSEELELVWSFER